jgi:bla regulator protein BlaR1
MMASEVLLDAWWAAMGRACWQGGLAVLLIWSLCRLLPTTAARVRGWFWRLAVLKFLVVLFWLIPVPVPLLPTRAVTLAEVDLPVSHRSAFVADGMILERQARAEVGRASGGFSMLRAVLFAAWLAGAGLALGKLLAAGRDVVVVRRGARPLAGPEGHRRLRELTEVFGLRRVPTLLQIDGEGSPRLIGIFQAAIVFPANTWQRLNDLERSLALEHELAHIKRWDPVWNWLAAFVRALFFFHPLVWCCERHLRLSQELAADELAVTGRRYDPVRYARLLLSIVGKLGPARPLPTVTVHRSVS